MGGKEARVMAVINMSEETDRKIAEWLGFRVFRPSEIKMRGAYDQESYGVDMDLYILPQKKRAATHMIDAQPLPRFDQNPRACLELLEAVRAKGYEWSIEAGNYPWNIHILRGECAHQEKYFAIGDTLPAAVAAAVLALIDSLDGK